MTAAIIPARYASSRFPGKPLIDIHGKTMIMRVYEQCIRANFTEVIIATDDERIQNEALKYNAKVIMTNPKHDNGTQRCAEAATILPANIQNIVNVQGDEPFIAIQTLNEIIACLESENYPIVSFCKFIHDVREINSENVVKVITDKDNKALYFSRSAIPFNRDKIEPNYYKKHIGLYGFKRNILADLVNLPESKLELYEKLEQLRWLENGFAIKMLLTENESLAIDSPEDLDKILSIY
jgi:3-deoxy-manno-octulosonate cytidylyltransferase (CMP-KDO synthetase)